MRWKSNFKNRMEEKYQKWRKTFDWCDWFAWYPVKFGDKNCEQWVWFEKIERKRFFRKIDLLGNKIESWEYRFKNVKKKDRI